MHRLRLALALATATTAVPAPAKAQVAYTIRDLTPTGLPGSSIIVTGINNAGQVVLHDTGGSSHAYRVAVGGTVNDPGADLGTLGGILAVASDINDSGQVVGHAYVAGTPANSPEWLRAYRTTPSGQISDPGAVLTDTPGQAQGINATGQVTGQTRSLPNNMSQAFRSTPNGQAVVLTPLGTYAGYVDSFGLAINASGQVAGIAESFTSPPRIFRTTATGMVSDPGTDLGNFGGSFGVATPRGRMMNDAGQVIGASYLPGNVARHAFRTAPNGRIDDPGTDLGTLGGTNSLSQSINNLGVVVGSSVLAGDAITHAFIFDTQMRNLNDLIPVGTGWELNVASAINDFGLIAGTGIINGQTHAFLLTPVTVPEPGSLGMVGGAVVGGWLVRRRASGRRPGV